MRYDSEPSDTLPRPRHFQPSSQDDGSLFRDVFRSIDFNLAEESAYGRVGQLDQRLVSEAKGHGGERGCVCEVECTA